MGVPIGVLAWALSLPAIAVARLPPGEPEDDQLEPLRLVATYGYGDPIALAAARDGERMWSVDGAVVTEWTLAAGSEGAGSIAPQVKRRFPLDLTVHSLLHADERLLVAAGSSGLWTVELELDEPRARRVEARADLLCTDVASVGGRVLATFAALQGSLLCVYDSASFELLGEVRLPDGVAWALAADEEHAWLAMGTGGLARVDLANPTAPRVEAGPGPEAFPPAGGSSHGANVVRDVALSGTHVYAAADGAGLIAVRRAAPWSRNVPLECVQLELGGAPTFASRVAAEGDTVLVGSNLAPVAAQDGAPFGLHGWMDERLHVGGVLDDSFVRGRAEGLFAFQRRGGELELVAQEATRGGWRTLALQGRVYEQHVGDGWRVRAGADASFSLLATERPTGYAAMDGSLSLLDPNLVLFGTDPAGSKPAGWLQRSSEGALGVRASTSASAPLGLLVGAQWLEESTGQEWCLVGEGFGCRLLRLDHEDPESSPAWPIDAIVDLDGSRPMGYFSSSIDGDVIYLAQARTRTGLLGVSAARLTEAARAVEPGTHLELEPLFQVRTHELGAERWMFTWKPALYDAPDGRRIAVVPTGLQQEHEGGSGPAQTSLYDVSAAAQGEVRLVGGFRAPRSVGHALAVQVAEVDGRSYAFVVDYRFGVDVLDVTEPSDVRRVGAWPAPVSSFDLKRSNVLDLELGQREGGGLDVWLAAGRLGVVRLDGSDPCRFDLPLLETHDTPGWAVGLCLRMLEGRRVLLVGDQKGGLREYR